VWARALCSLRLRSELRLRSPSGTLPRARGVPRRAHTMIFSTASVTSWLIASTLPSARLRTQPRDAQRLLALFSAVATALLPARRPLTLICRVIMHISRSVSSALVGVTKQCACGLLIVAGPP